MLVLCVYGLWEQSKLVGAVLVVLVVGGVSAAIGTSIGLREKKLVGNLLHILIPLNSDSKFAQDAMISLGTLTLSNQSCSHF